MIYIIGFLLFAAVILATAASQEYEKAKKRADKLEQFCRRAELLQRTKQHGTKTTTTTDNHSTNDISNNASDYDKTRT